MQTTVGFLWMFFAVALIAAACGGSSSTETTTAATTDEPTATTALAAPSNDEVDDAFEAMEESIGDLTDDVEELEAEPVETTTTVVEAEPAESSTDSGASLSPDAPLEEVQAILADVLGSTDDVATEARRLAQFPADVPTLPDALIFDVQFEVARGGEGFPLRHSNRVSYWTTATGPDALTFYDAELAARGYEILDTTSQESGDGATAAAIRTSLGDDGTLSERTLEVVIRTGDYEGTQVAFWFQAADSDTAQALPYASWTSSSPLPEAGGLQRVTLGNLPIGTPLEVRSNSGSIGAVFAFDALDEATLRTQIGEVLASGGEYTLTGELDSFQIAMASPRFSRVSAQIQGGATDSSANVIASWDIPSGN